MRLGIVLLDVNGSIPITWPFQPYLWHDFGNKALSNHLFVDGLNWFGYHSSNRAIFAGSFCRFFEDKREYSQLSGKPFVSRPVPSRPSYCRHEHDFGDEAFALACTMWWSFI